MSLFQFRWGHTFRSVLDRSSFGHFLPWLTPSNCPTLGVALGVSVLSSGIRRSEIRRSASRCRPWQFAARRFGVTFGVLPWCLISVSQKCTNLHSVCTNLRSVCQSAYPGTALPKTPSAVSRTNWRTWWGWKGVGLFIMFIYYNFPSGSLVCTGTRVRVPLGRGIRSVWSGRGRVCRLNTDPVELN